MKSINRICIYPKDIMLLTGKSERYSRTLLRKIKAGLKKEEHQLLTISELSTYFGISQEEISKVIR
ncbi:MAG: hypothetical protein MUF75_03435 [Bacteroidia bacterium]|nr:hypothetical protein [Bacteroidia bacterium]